MTLGTTFVNEALPVAVGGSIINMTAAQATTQFGSGNIKTPTKNFSIAYRGHTVVGRVGVPIVVDAGLLAALTAAGAPVV
jgi:hypothetical protein